MRPDHPFTRRQFLAAAGAGAAAAGLAACGSSSTARTGAAKAGAGSKAPLKPATITFTTWAGPAEETAFKQVVARFEAAHPTIKVP